MTTKVAEIISVLEDRAPISLQESYDNCGLLTGSPEWDVHGVLCCLDCTEAVLDEAIRLHCNLIVCHHPIIFGGLKSLTGKNYVERIVIKAIRNDLAIYAIHTNLDKVLHGGVNGMIGSKLNLKDIQTLLEERAGNESSSFSDQVYGSGIIGKRNKGVTELEFMEEVKEKFGVKLIRHSPLLNRKISNIAACGGSGSFLLEEAIRQKADVFISSDFKYHDFFDADGKILILDIGHYESEQFTIELLYSMISQNFSNFAAHCTKNITNSIQYF